MLRENLSINITPNGVPLVIHISQYDVGLRTFVFTPYTSAGTFTPDTAVSATLEGTKPDGNIIIHNCEYDSATGQITYTIQEQLAAVAGRVWSKIVLRDTNGNAIGYTAIVWLVDMAGVVDGAVASESDISALQEFVNEFGTINAYKSALDGALAAIGGPLAANTVSEMTDRTRVYVYTGDETGYTKGHWYYWDGSAWTDGGVYQAMAIETDKSLTVLNMAADAKSTGDAIAAETTARQTAVSNETTARENAITELKNDLNKMFPVEPVGTTFFENLNYGVPSNVSFYNDRYPNNDGKIVASNTTSSIVVNVKPNTTYYLYVPSRNRQVVIETADDFSVGETYTKLAVTTPTSYNGILVLSFTTGSSATKIMAYIYAGTYDYDTNKNGIIITENEFVPTIQPTIKRDFIPNQEIGQIRPKDTTFFSGINYFSPDEAFYYTDRSISNSTYTVNPSTTAKTLVIPVLPSTKYYLHIPNPNRGVIVESEDNDFYVGSTHTPLYTSGPLNIFTFTTGVNAHYIAVYFATGDYDYEANKGSIVLNIDEYTGNASPYISAEYLPKSIKNSLDGTNVLIFGDSITDTCNFTINSSDQTTEVSWKNPSNSYVNGNGQTITYNMWPKMLKDMGLCAEVRNYARQGATFKDATRPSGEERQNVSYQITVALNDLSNPHGVFDVDDFVPDIVIFALGTNDGTPNDTYDSAMAKTVLKSDGYSIDTTATLANLDMSKFCEAARSAFLRTRIAFPYAQFFCVLPIQRANNEVNGGDLNTYLSRMAKRYGCVIIDGFAESGMIRDTNNWNALGDTLKDGLHPNDKGQNMLFRAIYGSLISHYVDLEVMNP